MLGVDLVTVGTGEGAALGAALLAGVGSGLWPSVEAACADAVQLGETTRTDPDAAAAYNPVYQRFRDHYPALQPLFRAS